MNKDLILGLKFAFSYFSIIPIKFDNSVDLSKKEIINYLMFFLPLVGAVLSLGACISFYFLEDLSYLGAIICAFLYMMFYGFIHTEAILDVVDALYAKHSGKDAYEVIKEPTIGAMGFLYALGFVCIKVAALVMLFLNQMYLEIIAIAIISRVSVQFMTKTNEFKSSFVGLMKNSFTSFKTAFALYFIVCLVLIGFKAFTLFFIALVFTFLFSLFLEKNLGFLNGDTLGFNLELTEIVLFITVCLFWLN
ncbi:adenosylcobinamide-GDP ribazoletransferase [Arcobacter sp. CECT 8983]|uniref:adenosylcobinamide-GDP ribazoletransferase n=1 Tax=Arcobacter sp. CECT 8983 TaxID=2044508 RepID=UPI0013E8FB00|nr:adenosylcobinamide-GDP ribazoletransferase [Arcobacter sp. CECT 8983]